MNKATKNKNAFTLIEVMVAVMIISVVIMALIQMYANNTHIFLSLKNQTKANQYSSFLIGNKKHGYEDKSISMYDLVDDFDLSDDLRRKLKDIKVNVIYSELDAIDLSESDTQESSEDIVASELVLEIGKSILKTESSSSSLLRFRLQ